MQFDTDHFDPEAYLARLAIDAPKPGADGLAALQEAQLSAIAFENLDPLTGRVPDLDPQALADKLLARRRGGYCFELNSLFGRALSAFGFKARAVMCRVRNGAPVGGHRSHLAFVVENDGREWIADTGFGGPGPRWPVPIVTGHVEEQGVDAYRVVQDENTGEIVLEKRGDEGWSGLYGFDRARVQLHDLEAANFVCARWEKAVFPANLTLNRLTPTGRVSAFNTAVTVVHDGQKTTRTLQDAGDLARLLASDFGLAVAPDMLATAAARIGLSPIASTLSSEAVSAT